MRGGFWDRRDWAFCFNFAFDRVRGPMKVCNAGWGSKSTFRLGVLSWGAGSQLELRSCESLGGGMISPRLEGPRQNHTGSTRSTSSDASVGGMLAKKIVQ